MSKCNIDYDQKDWWRDFDVDSVKDETLLHEVITNMESVIGSLWTQIETAKIKSNNGNCLDEEWYYSVNTAFNKAKQKKKLLETKKQSLIKARNYEDNIQLKENQKMIAIALTNIVQILTKINEKL